VDENLNLTNNLVEQIIDGRIMLQGILGSSAKEINWRRLYTDCGRKPEPNKHIMNLQVSYSKGISYYRSINFPRKALFMETVKGNEKRLFLCVENEDE
jgi:hypothetical protein